MMFSEWEVAEVFDIREGRYRRLAVRARIVQRVSGKTVCVCRGVLYSTPLGIIRCELGFLLVDFADQEIRNEVFGATQVGALHAEARRVDIEFEFSNGERWIARDLIIECWGARADFHVPLLCSETHDIGPYGFTSGLLLSRNRPLPVADLSSEEAESTCALLTRQGPRFKVETCLCEIEFDPVDRESVLYMQITSKKSTPQQVHQVVLAALEIMCAEEIDAIRTKANFGIAYRHELKSICVVRREHLMPPPICVQHSGHFWTFFRALIKLSTEHPEKFHAVVEVVRLVRRASGADDVRLAALTASIAVESLYDLFHERESARVSKDQVDQIVNCVQGCEKVEQDLRNRSANLLKSQLGQTPMKEKIQRFCETNRLDPCHFKNWRRTRNSLAHGNRVGDRQDGYDGFFSCVFLIYNLIPVSTGAEFSLDRSYLRTTKS